MLSCENVIVCWVTLTRFFYFRVKRRGRVGEDEVILDLCHLPHIFQYYLSIYLFIYLSICLSIYLSIYLSIPPSIYISIFLWLNRKFTIYASAWTSFKIVENKIFFLILKLKYFKLSRGWFWLQIFRIFSCKIKIKMSLS